MAHLSLIVLTGGSVQATGSIDPVVDELMRAGHQVEVMNVLPLGSVASGGQIQSDVAGMAAAAVAGLDASSGEILVVLDPAYGYSPGDVVSVVAPLLHGEAEVVVGSRYSRAAGGLRRLVGAVAKLACGTSDPLSGLVAISRGALTKGRAGFLALGHSFALELVIRVPGRHVETPIRSVPAWRRFSVSWDDVRHIKRLADHRYGTWSRLVQFCTVGASGMVVDLSVYALLLWVLSGTPLFHMVVPFTQIKVFKALARVSAIFVALCWNFFLNRRLTFSDMRGDYSIVRQFIAYGLSNCLSILVSLGLSLGLPRRVEFFSRHELTAAVIGIVVGILRLYMSAFL